MHVLKKRSKKLRQQKRLNRERAKTISEYRKRVIAEANERLLKERIDPITGRPIRETVKFGNTDMEFEADKDDEEKALLRYR